MRVGLDIDGVLGAFDKHFLDYLDFEDKTPSKIWDDPRIVNHFHRIESDVNFWLTMPRLIEPDELDFIPVIYVTARNIATSITKKWLKINGFPEAPVITVGKDGSKVDALKNVVDVFIDDAYHNYTELNKGGVKCLLMSAPYNVQYNRVDKRIYSINQVLNYD